VLHAKLLNEESLVSFRRSAALELRLAAHPNIVQLHGWSVSAPHARVMLVMERASGGSLEALIDRGTVGTWSERELLGVARQMVRGIAYLHAQSPPLVHRDLKPPNILFSGGVPKIADFGASRAVDGTTMTKFAVGTVLFSAPEQLKYHAYDAAVDVWAFGCCLACMARQHNTPFAEGEMPSGQLITRLLEGKLRPTVSPEHVLHEYVLDCCLEARERPTAAALLARFTREVGQDLEDHVRDIAREVSSSSSSS